MLVKWESIRNLLIASFYSSHLSLCSDKEKNYDTHSGVFFKNCSNIPDNFLNIVLAVCDFGQPMKRFKGQGGGLFQNIWIGHVFVVDSGFWTEIEIFWKITEKLLKNRRCARTLRTHQT